MSDTWVVLMQNMSDSNIVHLRIFLTHLKSSKPVNLELVLCTLCGKWRLHFLVLMSLLLEQMRFDNHSILFVVFWGMMMSHSRTSYFTFFSRKGWRREKIRLLFLLRFSLQKGSPGAAVWTWAHSDSEAGTRPPPSHYSRWWIPKEACAPWELRRNTPLFVMTCVF